MKKPLRCSDIVYKNTYEVVFDITDSCPICHNGLLPSILFASVSRQYNKAALLLFCPKCHNYFITTYNINFEDYPIEAINGKSAPINSERKSFDDCITAVSPQFVEIYNQSFQAEQYGLNEIAGMGYRKALEFLIKDYLILKAPENTDSIKSTLLGKCIPMLNNKDLETVASRAAWLGNDQTHYIQKFEDKDISDLKRLIRLTVHWISMLLETDAAAMIERR